MKTLANKIKLLNENVDKQSQNTHIEVNIRLPGKSQRLEVGSGLFRIIFTSAET